MEPWHEEHWTAQDQEDETMCDAGYERCTYCGKWVEAEDISQNGELYACDECIDSHDCHHCEDDGCICKNFLKK